MKKLGVVILALLLILLQGCAVGRVEHEIRDVPTEMSYHELVTLLSESTVALHGYDMEFYLGLGSGLIFKQEDLGNGSYMYYVLTNYHVVDRMSHMEVHIANNKVEIGDIYGIPTDTPRDYDDVAVVRFISNTVYKTVDILPLNEEKNIYVQLTKGQYVFGLGTPVDEDNFNLLTNLGVIADLSDRFITHTANINPGNSGGPLFSYDGTFIGMNTQRVEVINEETVYLISESIHVNHIAKVIKNLLNNIKPRLGIQTLPYDVFTTVNYQEAYGERAAGFDPFDKVPRNEVGIVVADTSSTRSSYGKLLQYDLIKKVNGSSITTTEDLLRELGTIQYGNVYTFEVIRKNSDTGNFENIEVEITI